MLDMGWSEMTVVLIVLLVVVGPSELPKIIKGMRSFMSSVQRVRSEVRGHMDEIVRESDLKDVLESEKRSISDTVLGEGKVVDEHLDPLRTIGDDINAIKTELKNVGTENPAENQQNLESKNAQDEPQVK